LDSPRISYNDFPEQDEKRKRLVLDNGSKIAVVGSGPAGSFFSYYLLDMAERLGLDIYVDIYEPRDFSHTAPKGCNMCGGIVSETLVQTLAADGINLPPTVVQRGIDSYYLHMDVGDVRIETPLKEKRIGAVTRGSGPRDIKEIKWESFDGHLQKLATAKGANVINERVTNVNFNQGRPRIKTRRGSSQTYDMLAVAVGVNSPALNLFNGLDIGYHSPETTKTFICEYYLGSEIIEKYLGSSMHVFLLNIPRLEFAAIIPKGDYATVCMLGENIDDDLVKAFLDSPEVRATMPLGWQAEKRSCWCFPRINVKGAHQPYFDRIVFIGDCGVTRLYKDGIGAAYRTAKAAASTAIFQGISTDDFRQYYMPACKTINSDNAIGKLSFIFTSQIQKYRLARRGLLKMTIEEQDLKGSKRRMSTVLWDMFTGSAPYRDIFLSTLHPAFLSGFLKNIASSLGRE
jgi:flavin-dependent dehydrogenase